MYETDGPLHVRPAHTTGSSGGMGLAPQLRRMVTAHVPRLQDVSSPAPPSPAGTSVGVLVRVYDRREAMLCRFVAQVVPVGGYLALSDLAMNVDTG